MTSRPQVNYKKEKGEIESVVLFFLLLDGRGLFVGFKPPIGCNRKRDSRSNNHVVERFSPPDGSRET